MQDIGSDVEGNKRVASDTGILAEEDIKSPYGVCELAECISQYISVER